MKAFFREKLELKGISPLIALDKLVQQNIKVYKVQKKDVQTILFEVKSNEVQKIFAFFSNSCYTIKCIGENLPQKTRNFILFRLGIVIGIFCFYILAFCSNFFIFNVHISGSGSAYATEAMQILKEHNLRRFTVLNRAAIEQAKTDIIALTGIEYVQIEKQGTVLYVTLFEAEESQPIVMQKNLVAQHTGIVESMIVLRGTATVQVGAYVKKGQVIVVGQFIDSKGEVYQTNAIARCTIVQTFQAEHITDTKSKKEESKAIAKAHFAVGGIIIAKQVQILEEKDKVRYIVTLTVRHIEQINL